MWREGRKGGGEGRRKDFQAKLGFIVVFFASFYNLGSMRI